MVNTLGLSRGDIIHAIEAETGAHFEEVRTYKPICPRPGNYVAVAKAKVKGIPEEQALEEVLHAVANTAGLSDISETRIDLSREYKRGTDHD